MIKWGKLPDTQILYIRSMGKVLRVTAIFDSVESANRHSERTDDAVVAEFMGLVLMANLYDKGIPIPRDGAREI